MTRSTRIGLIGVAVLTFATVLLLTHRPAVHAAWLELKRVPPAAVAAALLLILCQVACQACRLWAILPRGALSLRRAAYAFVVGEWTNIFTPARAGDALKVVLLQRVAGSALNLSAATGAVLADKVVDIGSLVLLCIVSGVAGAIWARVSIPVLILVLCAAVVIVVLARRWIVALKDPRRLAPAMAFSLGAWMAEVLALRVLCNAVEFPQPLPQLVLALALLNAGVSVPLSPANLGIYEAALAFGLTQSGVTASAAVAIATLHHALELLSINIAAGTATALTPTT